MIVDEVIYSEDTPWMSSADGLGHSLHRSLVNGAGIDPPSWSAQLPTPEAGTSFPPPQLSISQDASQLRLGFDLLPGFSYQIEMKTNSLLSDRFPYTTVTNPATEYTINLPPETGSAIFRLRRDL